MLPFAIPLRLGEPIADQIVFASIRAVLAGELKVGDAFPSVRVLAGELSVHPNTVHKAMLRLIAEGWLETRPGVGAFVASPPEARAGERTKLLDQDVEKLAVEARRVGLGLDEVVAALTRRWNEIDEGGR